MALQLPLELETEILSCLPPQSLSRFRSVCKRWNSLFNEETFVNKHWSRSRPQLVFQANNKAYLIDVINLDLNSVGPTIDLDGLPSFDLPLQDNLHDMSTCDEFLFCSHRLSEVIRFWNPLLKQGNWFEYVDEYSRFPVLGVGYDNSGPEKAYKVLSLRYGSNGSTKVAIYDCESQVYKLIDKPADYIIKRFNDGQSSVSLNGNLYWVSYNPKTKKWLIQGFDFSMETFKTFCLLPCQKSHDSEKLVLAAFKADRFSLLKLSSLKQNIEIWVMKKQICREEEDVEWIKLMTCPTLNLPRRSTSFDRISYFIFNKNLYMCFDDHITPGACIYIVRKDLRKMIEIGSGITYFCHCVFTPNFISVPYLRG